MPLQPSGRLGPHEILTPTGAGGTGDVRKARDTGRRNVDSAPITLGEQLCSSGTKWVYTFNH